MTIDVDRLETLDDVVACERLQRRILGDRSGRAVGIPALRAIIESGGLLLGIRTDRVTHELAAAAVSLRAEWERFPALFDLFVAVAEDSRGRGLGVALRRAQRRAALDDGVEVVRSWIDPLESCESHLAWNRVGAIGVTYERNALGEVSGSIHGGLASDRVLSEWWLRSPRTIARMDEDDAPAHRRVGLHEMTVATRTTPGPAGQRLLADLRVELEAAKVLVEIPADIGRLETADADEARRWRLGTREAFERWLAAGYLFVGLVREGGRSFQLLEHVDRAGALGRS